MRKPVRLSEVAIAAGVTPRQLGYWVRIGLVSPVRQTQGDRVVYSWEPEDVYWALAVADLVRAGLSVDYLSALCRAGTVSEGLAILAQAVKSARESVPWYSDPNPLQRLTG